MRSPTPAESDDARLDLAYRDRRRRQLEARSQPADSATGTARIAERLARAKAEAGLAPRPPREAIDLTEAGHGAGSRDGT